MEVGVTFRRVDGAGVAQLVEHELPKLGVAGSNPVVRSFLPKLLIPGNTSNTSLTMHSKIPAASARE